MTPSDLPWSVVDDENHFVELETTFGGRRILDWLVGDALPGIC